MLKPWLTGLRMTLMLTALTGIAYPGLVTLFCQLAFPESANGSFIIADGTVLGSSLIGQTFTRPEYFHPRPSAAGLGGYDASVSGGSNLGPTSKAFIDRIAASAAEFRKENPDYWGPIPADLLTASASGLDPHISPASAYAQEARVARARGVSMDQIDPWIGRFTEGPSLGFLGEPRVNVLKINLAFDRLFPLKQGTDRAAIIRLAGRRKENGPDR
jgi:potassium-transporting ATPase KdpC subunit